MHLDGHDGFAGSIVIAEESPELLHEMVTFVGKEFLPDLVSGYSVSRETAAVIARERPMLLICSYHMPLVGGVDLITLARKRWGNVPAIVLVRGTGLGPGEYTQAGENTVYLEKPFPLSTLYECVVTLRAGQLRWTPAWSSDPSLSHETPLPPPSRTTSPLAEPHQAEAWDVLDEEIEIVDEEDGPDSPKNDPSGQPGRIEMALTTNNVKENLSKLEGIEGFMGAALADSESGMCLGYIGGGGGMNLEVAAAANTEVVRSKRKAIKSLNLRDEIEDILITLSKQYHLIRPVRTRPNLFFYLVLDRQRSNLAMARFSLADTERELPM